MKSKTRRMELRSEFKIKPRHLRTLAFDVAETTRAFFESVNQSPCFVIGPKVEDAQALRKSLRRAMKSVTFVGTVPRSARCVAIGVTVERSSWSCTSCGERAKSAKTTLAYLDHARRVDGPPEHRSVQACVACGVPVEDDEDALDDILEGL